MNENISNKKQIVIFTYGDSNLLKTWSNVPYFLTKTLERNGWLIYRVDISTTNMTKVEKIILLFFSKYIKFLNKYTNNKHYSVERTSIFRCFQYKIIKNAFNKYNDVNYFIFLSFSHFYKLNSNQKTIMICDWSYEYWLDKHLNKKPAYFENKFIKTERACIKQADYVISLFPDVKNYMQEKYDKNIYYFGHIINNFKDSVDVSIKEKYNNNHLLFIGSKKYISSIENIVLSIIEHNKSHKTKLFVDIIGLTTNDSDLFKYKYVKCFGYLDKSVGKECSLYYFLISKSKFILNTVENWNGMSSIFEALYFYNPFIVVPNSNTILMFGKEPNCGFYILHNDVHDIKIILNICCSLTYKNYEKLAISAHNNVKNNTWDNFVKNILSLIEH